MKKIIILVYLILIMSCFVFADQDCYVGRECTFTTVVQNTSQVYVSGNVTNTLINSSGSIIFENQNMTEIKEGRYSYNYTFNKSGVYLRESNYAGDKENEQIVVSELSIEDTVFFSISNSNMLKFVIFFLLIIIVLCFFIFFNKKNKVAKDIDK